MCLVVNRTSFPISNFDRVVIRLYKFKPDMSKPAILAALMEMYQKLTEKPTMISEEETKKKRTRWSKK